MESADAQVRRISPPALLLCAAALLLAACASTPPVFREPEGLYRAVDRIGWGATQQQIDEAGKLGWSAYVDRQLSAAPAAPLLPGAQSQIDALKISQQSMQTIFNEMDELRRNQDKPPTEAERIVTRQAYQAALNLPAREAGHRQLLRQMYSDQQLLEQMSWFWFNHFNVHQYKREIRVFLPDYEESALRPNALGKFRDLLAAVARHPAMQRYLDNDQNSAGRPNENYARELLELHTMGVSGGYSQGDVQELARVLTGFGTRTDTVKPKLKPEHEKLYVREGMFEFNPARHDFGDKTILGQKIKAKGPAELDEVLDLLVAQPATARFVSYKLAQFFIADEPPAAVVTRMAATFGESKGDIKATMRVLLMAPEFALQAPKFKDPQHYLVSSLRTSYVDGAAPQVIINSQPVLGWLRRLGQGPYDRLTPDGYPATAGAWNSAGQMSTRFELARIMAGGTAGMFKLGTTEVPATRPTLSSSPLVQQTLQARLSATTRAALAQADTPPAFNALLLSSPEFMYR